MFDLHRYPCNLNLIRNVEEIVVYLTRKSAVSFSNLCEETISRTYEGQPRPKYIFNKCGTNLYFFTLQRFGPSPSTNFKASLLLLIHVRRETTNVMNNNKKQNTDIYQTPYLIRKSSYWYHAKSGIAIFAQRSLEITLIQSLKSYYPSLSEIIESLLKIM